MIGTRPVVNCEPCGFTLEEGHTYVFSNFSEKTMYLALPDEVGSVIMLIQPQGVFVLDVEDEDDEDDEEGDELKC